VASNQICFIVGQFAVSVAAGTLARAAPIICQLSAGVARIAGFQHQGCAASKQQSALRGDQRVGRYSATVALLHISPLPGLSDPVSP
jgi:hypothetical protein